MKNRFIPIACASLSIVLISGCTSNLTRVTTASTPGEEVLGKAEGTACGSLLILSPAVSVIPVRLNSRVERAYQYALESVPGATRLTHVTVDENWYWWVIGTARCFTVSGDAVR